MTRTYLVALIGMVVLLAGCGSGTLNAPLETQTVPVIILLYVPPQATPELDLFTSHVHEPGPVPVTDRSGNVRGSVMNGHVLAVNDGRELNLILNSIEADCEGGVLSMRMTDTGTKEAYAVSVRKEPDYYMRTQQRTGGGPNTDWPDCLIWDVGGAGVTLRFEVLGFFDLSPLCGTA